MAIQEDKYEYDDDFVYEYNEVRNMTVKRAMEYLDPRPEVYYYANGRASPSFVARMLTKNNPILRKAFITVVDALKQTQWISVKDRLPESIDEDCIVFSLFDGGKLAVGWYDRETKLWRDLDYNVLDDDGTTVTHWMPAPDKPERERAVNWEEV